MAKTKSAPAAPSDRVALVAIEPIKIDGVDVAPGEAFEAKPADAEALLAAGAARPADGE